MFRDVRPAGDARETLIDVSGDEPRVIDAPPPAAVWGVGYAGRRGVVVRGGGRGCLLAALLVALAICAQCAFFYYLLRWIF